MALFHYPFPEPLHPGKLIRRFNRFLADVALEDGREITAHCVNTGRMEGLTLPGLPVLVSYDPSPKRKLQWTWQAARVGDYWVGANTGLPNRLVGAMLQDRKLPGFEPWIAFRPEVKYGENSRVDFLIEEKQGLHYLEVKNCHLIYPDGIGYFPDSLSVRATKHLRELIDLRREGLRASVLFTAQRTDTLAVRPSDVHDPDFAEVAREAHKEGVGFLALQVRPDETGLTVEKMIPTDLAPYETEPMRQWMEENRAKGPAWVSVKKKKKSEN